ncbi:type II toxin-antitoxin system HicB family antitoxin [Levilactobacillus suantsaiihabitans]|uniref:HicB family protein n=1 Tax=Levilactobacillus suantsaiihabitans TaxID=2487722 RepID=A0A4Z0JEF8_9LACO|nr:type II toxin-antitoxin system HicB family antitoxin [Levilactobacillus suantsaiihabitans]TGD19813.1 HicB family protein [Levilactobacillus suantsaiihabitans]
MAKEKIVVYPAVFIKDAETATFTVVFPDVSGAISQADSLGEAMVKAEEVLGLMLYDEPNLPEASSLAEVQRTHPKDTVQWVAVDLVKAAKGVTKPLVKKNTTIPATLAHEASERGINFSAVLTRALKAELGKS